MTLRRRTFLLATFAASGARAVAAATPERPMAPPRGCRADPPGPALAALLGASAGARCIAPLASLAGTREPGWWSDANYDASGSAVSRDSMNSACSKRTASSTAASRTTTQTASRDV
jgi:hypothetical protein